MLLFLLETILVETLPVACLFLLLSPMTTFNPATGYFFYSRRDRTWRGCEDSFMYMFIFPPPVLGMLATYL